MEFRYLSLHQWQHLRWTDWRQGFGTISTVFLFVVGSRSFIYMF
jgi:hypothetical protein